MATDPDNKTLRSSLRETFDQQALRYNRARHGYPDEIFDRIAVAGALTAGSKVLEIGPGTGQATRSMAGRGWQITGVELGSALANIGRAKLADFDNVEIVSGDVETLDLEPASFDAVTAFTCFHCRVRGTTARRNSCGSVESAGPAAAFERSERRVRAASVPMGCRVPGRSVSPAARSGWHRVPLWLRG